MRSEPVSSQRGRGMAKATSANVDGCGNSLRFRSDGTVELELSKGFFTDFYAAMDALEELRAIQTLLSDREEGIEAQTAHAIGRLMESPLQLAEGPIHWLEQLAEGWPEQLKTVS